MRIFQRHDEFEKGADDVSYYPVHGQLMYLADLA